MKKPSQKRLKEYFQNIEIHFTEIINAMLWYEKNDMDDWATDIVGDIEKLSDGEELGFLIQDFPSRSQEDKQVYAYHRLWWALINTESVEVYNTMAQYAQHNESFKVMLEDWYQILDDDVPTKHNIEKILKTSLDTTHPLP